MTRYLVLFVILLLSLNVVSALDVGFIVKLPTNLVDGDEAVKAFMEAENYNVVLLDDVAFDSSLYDVIVVGESVSDIGNIFDHTNSRTLFMSNSAAKKKGLASSSGFGSGSVARVEVVKGITSGFTLENINVYGSSSNLEFLTGCFPINSDILVTKSNSVRAIVLALDVNSLLIDDNCTDRDKVIAKRNVYFGLVGAVDWNTNAQTLFRNSIAWLIESQDLDGDGFDGIIDCNDDNADVYPGATEIAYNGLDDDCSDGDLVDVDGDGYDSTSVGGDDCNDNDATINPGSSDENKDCVNDGPTIDSFSPVTPIDLLENVDNTFTVTYSDVDSGSVTVIWKVNGIEVDTGSSYVLNRVQGSYIVTAVVSDGSFNTEQVWIVTLKDSSFFICSQVSGNICNSNQVCSTNSVSSSDSNSCCLGSCSLKDPEFSRADTCSVKESKIDIDFINVDNGKDYDIGDEIGITVRVRNNLDHNRDFNVDAYFYDLTENKIIEEFSEKAHVNDGKNQILGFEFDVETDLDADNDYALLIVVEDDECNQEFRRIDIVREEDEVIVSKIEVREQELSCGDPLNVNVYVENIGSEDQDVYLKIKNAKLKIDKQTNGFELEKFDEDDSEKKEFNLKIPDNIRSGDYTLRVELYYENQREFFDKIITLGPCGDEESSEALDSIVLGSSNINDLDSTRLGDVSGNLIDNGDVQEGDLGTDGGSNLFRNLFIVILLVFLGVAGFVVYNFSQD